MRAILRLWMLLVPMALAITACSSHTDNPASPQPQGGQESELADYTIIFYGYGGGNLDRGIVGNIAAFYGASAESYNRVNIAVQYKFSDSESLAAECDPETFRAKIEAAGGSQADVEEALNMPIFQVLDEIRPNGTYRFTVDLGKGYVQQFSDQDNVYGPDNCDISNQDSLTNFIRWAAETCPAKNYVFIISDHGGGYNPKDDLPLNAAAVPTRGLVYDNGHDNRHFSVNSLTTAIKASGIRPQVVYMDACLMNTAEYLFELKDICDYVVASTFVVPGAGGDYSVLVEELAKSSDIEAALAVLCRKSVDNWEKEQEPGAPFFCDISATRTRNLDAFGAKLREFVDCLITAYKSDNQAIRDAIDECTARAFMVERGMPNYDIVDYIEDIFDSAPSAFPTGLYEELGAAYNACIVKQVASNFLTDMGFEVDMSVMLGQQNSYYVTKHAFNEEGIRIPYIAQRIWGDGSIEGYLVSIPDNVQRGQWEANFETTYKRLAFDKISGWSRWIEVNSQQPCQTSPTLWEDGIAMDDGDDDCLD